MSNKNREQKIVATVACPTCGAAIGRVCRVIRGRPMVCAERRVAWQTVRPTQPVDIVIVGGGAGTAHARRLAPQSPEARAAIDRLRHQGGTWEPTGTLLIEDHAAGALITRLIADGWTTGETL